jgi:hypothetical protein
MPNEEDDPLFDMNDYVPPGGGLPEHLKGKSAEEVAAYYSGQLRATSEKVKDRQQQDDDQPPTPPKRQDPAPKPLTDADVAPALGTMIQSAKMVAKASLDDEGQKLFQRFKDEIEAIMKAGFRGVQLADAQNWLFAFNQVLGTKTTLLMKESREAEINRRTSESASPSAHEEVKDRELSPVELVVAQGLDIGAEGYKEGLKIMATDKWPLTFSNRRK